MQSLAVKYRPKEFNEVVAQKSVIKILERMIETGEIKNSILLCGASGCGKTTIGRIFANKINGGFGNPIEIDAASNNSVDNVREIVKSAGERSLSGKYKVYILDECHVFSSQAWQAWLKCIEEPPAFTVFIFCTTDPQKIPATILNRVMRFNLTRITAESIKGRLEYICEQEGFQNYAEACDYLSRIANGGMRDAISLLEKCANYSTDLSIGNVLNALGNYSYDTFFELCNALVDIDFGKILSITENYYNNGNDLKVFSNQFLDFCLDLGKYSIFKNCSITKIPSVMKEQMDYAVNFENSTEWFLHTSDKLLELKNMTIDLPTVEVVLLQIARGK